MTNLSPEFKQAVNQISAQTDANGYFVYDLDALASHLAALANQNTVKLWYAVKANPLSAIIETVAAQGINFDVASAGELDHVLAQQVAPERILNTGPAKSIQHFQSFLAKGVNTFVVESFNQLNWLQQAASQAGKTPQVLLRVQLQWAEGEKNPLGGNTLTPFGLGCDEWQGVNISDYPALNINGLHIFQWGNMLSNDKMFSLWSQMVPPLTKLAADIGMQLEVLDLGGGFGVDYENTGQRICWQQAMAHLADIKEQAGVNEIWLELGRYAMAEHGVYLTNVVDKKINFGQQQLVLAAGINQLIRPAITEQPFPVSLLRESNKELQNFHLHGPLCTSLDKLGLLPLPSDTDIDDTLVFSFAGAYGFTESMPFFLCHQIAAEYVVTKGQIKQLRAPEPASWYLR